MRRNLFANTIEAVLQLSCADAPSVQGLLSSPGETASGVGGERTQLDDRSSIVKDTDPLTPGDCRDGHLHWQVDRSVYTSIYVKSL